MKCGLLERSDDDSSVYPMGCSMLACLDYTGFFVDISSYSVYLWVAREGVWNKRYQSSKLIFFFFLQC